MLSFDRRPTFEEISTFIVALVILIASFYGLLRDGTSNDVRVIYGGLIGSVATFFFARSATKEATRHTIDAQNNGLQEVRKTVGRIEDGRLATVEERAARDASH